MRKLLILLLLISNSIFAQNNWFSIYSGPVMFTSKGDSWGKNYGIDFEYRRKFISLSTGFQIFQVIKSTDHLYNIPPDPNVYYNQEFRTGFFTNTFYLLPGLKSNFRKSPNIKIGIGPAFAFEYSSAPSKGYTILYPAVTKYPDPIFFLDYPEPSKKFNIAYLAKFEIETPVGKRFKIGAAFFIQQHKYNLNWGFPVSFTTKL